VTTMSRCAAGNRRIVRSPLSERVGLVWTQPLLVVIPDVARGYAGPLGPRGVPWNDRTTS
jgi:hypothetical protein